MEKVFSHGLLASPRDDRDIPLSAIAPIPARIPAAMQQVFDLTMLDQNGWPACVGYSLAAIKQDRELREKIHETFDGKWIYDECKKIDGHPELEGTYFRAGMKVLYDTGAKTISGADPARFKIGSYAIVDDLSFNNLKTAIFLYGSVLAGFVGSNAGWQNELLRKPKPGEASWQHAVALVGYTEDHLILHNSWGAEAGNVGMFLVPADYAPFEAWVPLTDLPTPPPGSIGWAAARSVDGAKQYIVNGKITTNLNLRESPNGKILKVVPKGTDVKVLPDDEANIAGYYWEKVLI